MTKTDACIKCGEADGVGVLLDSGVMGPFCARCWDIIVPEEDCYTYWRGVDGSCHVRLGLDGPWMS